MRAAPRRRITPTYDAERVIPSLDYLKERAPKNSIT
jgi:hypothetical protein